MPKKVIDLTGKRFGKLVVKEYLGNRMWLCQCDCGNTKAINGSGLNGGRTSSCGCIRSKNLVGQRFGRLLVLEKTNKKDKHGTTYYKCKCDCGKEIETLSTLLTSGHKLSCNCYRTECVKKANKKYNRIEIEGDIAKIYFSTYDGYTIIDKEDLPKVQGYLWNYTDKHKYAFGWVDGKLKLLHRLILPNENKNLVTDHINRNKLDNRKSNLRLVSHGKNVSNVGLTKANTSGYKHISYIKTRGYYSVSVMVDKKYHYIGNYVSLEKAKQKLEEYLIKNNLEELLQ